MNGQTQHVYDPKWGEKRRGGGNPEAFSCYFSRFRITLPRPDLIFLLQKLRHFLYSYSIWQITPGSTLTWKSVLFVPDPLVSVEIKFLDIGKPHSYSLKATGDQRCISVQEGNKAQAVSEQYNCHAQVGTKWTFYFLQLGCGSAGTWIFFSPHISILIANEQPKSEQRRDLSIFQCQVPWVQICLY